MIYLFIPRLEEILGKVYLPLALAIAVVGPMLVFYTPWQIASVSGYSILQLIMSTMRLNLLWLVVAVMLGWAYGMRTVLSFSKAD